MTPSLPTFSIASAMMSPMVRRSWRRWCRPGRSPCCRSRAWTDRFFEFNRQRRQRPCRCRASDPSGSCRRQPPSGLRDHGLGQNGGGGGAVTGHVGGLGGNLFDHLRAHVLELVGFSSISLATDTPSLVTVGAPKLFSSTTLRPLGPRVTLTALARRVDALHHALAGIIGKLVLLLHSLCDSLIFIRFEFVRLEGCLR